MRFVDEALITIKSGNGGHGCVSFRREKFVPKGGPDGGDGGRGGNVIFRASPRMLTLYDFRMKRKYAAENGRPGEGKQKYGRGGEDLVVDVPVGTLIYAIREPQPDIEIELDEEGRPKTMYGEVDIADAYEQDVQSGALDAIEAEEAAVKEAEERGEDTTVELLADLSETEQEVVVAQGGRGGKGNLHFKSSTMRAPRFAQPGEDGEELKIRLELKIMADVGLLGLPNAGKSTFISQVSAARPKIAAYPFTTLRPNLGVVENDFGRQIVIADIPGLIEGAHEGHGLGHRFLKHVERTRFLLHILSCEDMDVENPFAGFYLIDEELAQYSSELAEKQQLLVINKVDLLDDEQLAALKEKAAGRPVHYISALEGNGVEDLLEAIWQMIEDAEALEKASEK